MKRLIDENEKEIAEINMTPFVDIVLVILIIFMATATFMVEGKIPVNLPKSETGEAKEIKEKVITISIKKDGVVFFNDKKVSKEELEKLLKGLKKTKKVVVLRADKDVPFKNVVYVIDKCRKAGIERYLIETEKTVQ